MSTISTLHAREIYDSRGTPTIEVDCVLTDGSMGRAAVPSGASTGMYEAVELRDTQDKRLGGKGVRIAVNNVNSTIFEAVKEKDFTQAGLDEYMIELDGTPNKGVLGANAILGVSMAFAKAVAQSTKTPLWKYFRSLSSTCPEQILLPVPMMNVLNGGKHAEGASDIQEYMIIPVGAQSFAQALEMCASVFMTLKGMLHKLGLATTVGDEGGFAPSLGSNTKPLELVTEAITKAGYKPGEDMALALDAAASEFFSDGKYVLKAEQKECSAEEMIALYTQWSKQFPLVSMEDVFDQNAWSDYTLMTAQIGSNMQIVGDDLFVTNVQRLQQGIDQKAANSILIKLNQIGTVTETVRAIDLARKNGFTAVVSHRSGETEDTTIADFVLGLSTGQIKTGSMSRSERLAKYNQLLRLEEELAGQASYAGRSVFQRMK